MTEENYIEERPMDVKSENASAERSEKPEKNGTPVTGESPRQDEETPSLQEAIKEQAREDEAAQSSTFTLRRILGGDFLTTQMLRRQIGVILLCVVFIIIYISNRYSCQKKMLEIDKLNIELQDAKYKSLSSASELTERCRESNVLDMLKTNKDSLLKIPAQPPYIIEVPN
jgi:hypothetical protein